MKSIKYLIGFFIISFTAASAQNVNRNSQVSLFSDYKAAGKGDAVTIIVVESSTATNSAEKSTGRSSDIGFSGSGNINTGGSASGANADASLGTRNEFEGKGSTKTGGQVRTKISATIDSVLNNGNLMVRGSRKIVINGEEQLMKIKGIVRPSDIMADNSVLSYNISEAEIIFEGDGMINNNQKPGWLTRLFHWLF